MSLKGKKQRPTRPPKPFPIIADKCLSYLEACQSYPADIFLDRNTKNALSVARLYEAFLDGDVVMLESFSPLVVAGVLKKWLFHLRAPVVPAKMVDMFLKINELDSNARKRLEQLKRAVAVLPLANLRLLQRLAALFHRIAESSGGVTAEELAALFALVLIWPPQDESSGAQSSTARSGSVSGGDGALLLSVHVPALQMTAKMRFSKTATTEEAMQAIFKKARRLDRHVPWRVWLGAPKNIWMEPEHALQQYRLADGDTLTVKQGDTSAPPPYVIAAADVWLALVEEFRFIFCGGVIRFVSQVHRVPVARSRSGDVRGFRRRAVVDADAVSRQISAAEASSKTGAVDEVSSGNELYSGGSMPRTERRTNRDHYKKFEGGVEAGEKALELDLDELHVAFAGLERELLREVLRECGSVRAATEFLQQQSDSLESEQVLYNTLQLNDIRKRPAPPLPVGALPQPVQQKPAPLNRAASLPAHMHADRPAAPLPASAEQRRRQQTNAQLGGTSKAELFREIAQLNREVARLTEENWRLAADVSGDAAMGVLQAQVSELTAQLELIRERCSCGACRWQSKSAVRAKSQRNLDAGN